MNDLLKRLNMNNISDLFDEYYEKALKDSSMPEWLTEEYVKKAIAECYMKEELLDIVLPALPLIRENKDLVLFAKTLYGMLEIHKHHTEVFGGLEFPQAPKGENTLPYDLFTFFPMLARVHQSFFLLKEKGVDEEILKNTYTGVGGSIISSAKRTSRPTFPTLFFLWTTTYKNADLFNIGRFNFEIRRNCNLDMSAFINEKGEIRILMSEGIKVHKSGLILGSAGAKDEEDSFKTEYKEADEYYEGNEAVNETGHISKEKTKLSKDEWSLLCAPGDNYVSVHIPRDGDFNPEYIQRSIEDGRLFFKKLYPDTDFKAFMCISWLLSPDLKALLKPTSNIISFQNRFYKFPVLCSGLDVFNFVFLNVVSDISEVDLNALPQNSSLEKGLKNLYQSGDFIHEAGGVFPF